MKRKNKKGLCLICTQNGLVPMTVMNIGDTGLVFFKSERYTPKKGFNWSLTHLDSGLSVCRFRTRKNLMMVLEEILDLADWTQNAQTLNTLELRATMQRIQQKEQYS